MEGLLTIFVALTAVAVMLQAGVLIAIYLVTKRTSEQFEKFTKDARELMVPIKSISDNMKTVSEDLIEVGLSAKEQFRRVEAIIRAMTPRERRDPTILNGSRRRRIAAGAGTDLTDVNRLIKQHAELSKLMKQLSGGGGRRAAAMSGLMGRR